MDVAMHRAGVTFVLDRAGVTGPDGASHHGMWDLAMLQSVPGIRVAAPRDAAQVGEQLREAVEKFKPVSVAALVAAYESAVNETKRETVVRRSR